MIRVQTKVIRVRTKVCHAEWNEASVESKKILRSAQNDKLLKNEVQQKEDDDLFLIQNIRQGAGIQSSSFCSQSTFT